MPWVVVMLLAPEMPPVTEADKAEIEPDPPTVSAVGSLELSARLQLLRTIGAFPCTLPAPLAVASSARTQAFPPLLPRATARAKMVSGAEVTTAEKRRDWG